MEFKKRPSCLLAPIFRQRGVHEAEDGRTYLCYEVYALLDMTEEESRLVSDAIVDACVKIESNR
jgi:hypothetical protein